jgi:hypothetical protein
MDISGIAAVTSSVAAAASMAKALMGIRDHVLISERVAALYDQLLKAQEGLLAHNTALLQLQEEHFKVREEVRALKEAASDRGRYSLFKFPSGSVAYRMNVTPEEGGAVQPGAAQPEHYICQPCYDIGRKVVLQPRYLLGGISGGLECTACQAVVIDS